MKIQLVKKVTEQVPVASRFTVKELAFEGQALQDALNEYLSLFTVGILDPDVAGKKPDLFVSNLQSGRLGDFSKRYILVACDGEKTVGILIGLPDPESVFHLYALHVAPEHRGQGVGSLLLSACINHLYRNRVGEIVLDVHTDNKPAYNLYRKYGFIQRN